MQDLDIIACTSERQRDVCSRTAEGRRTWDDRLDVGKVMQRLKRI